MKVGIVHTKKPTLDSNRVYDAWEKGIKAVGDTPIHIYSFGGLESNRDIGCYTCVSYPHFDASIRPICDDFPEIRPQQYVRAGSENALRIELFDWCKGHDKRVLILDTGLFKTTRNRDGDPDNYYTIGFDHIKGLGHYYNQNSPSDRWDSLGLEIKPWQNNESNDFLVVGQLQWGVGSQHINIGAWYKHVTSYLRDHYHNAFFKVHPNSEPWTTSKFKIKYWEKRNQYSELRSAYAFSSNFILELLLEGVPTVVMSKLSPAYSFCSHELADIENPKTFDRTQLFNDMAYCQWTPNEIADGTVWNRYKPYAFEGYKGV